MDVQYHWPGEFGGTGLALKYYKVIYALQDRLTRLICSIKGDFYLTGGTCLNRFYFKKRFSDHLDFFYMDPSLFREWIRETGTVIRENGFDMTTQIDTRDFIRIMIEKKLKIDMVNDRVYRFGKTIKTADGIKLDNVENILASKLTAIVGRDEPKDVFDFHTIVSCAVFNWKEILDAVKLKCVFENDALLARLRSFPVAMFDRLSVIDSCNIDSAFSSAKNLFK
ncbi:MAG TPA: hypothetical protein ENH82_18375 [bacterium]|nr:hypothetical protein [bacterium]